MEQPLVSVVIPFYSGIKWLEEALYSVQNQTYKNIEILVINDGSKENLEGLNTRFNINILNKENGGPASARNLGILKSTGKYIAFLDSDDLWLPDKLSRQINYMEKNDSIWSQHSYEMFWEESDRTKIINTKKYIGNVYKDSFISLKIQTSCVVVLRSVLISNNIHFPQEKRYGQDGAFYRQLASKYPLDYIDGVLSRFRIRGSNAGFRAKVQLDDKAATWKEIEKDRNVQGILPKPILGAFRMSFKISKMINQVSFYVKNENLIEVISKFAYIFPYAIYKMYAKK